MMDKVAKGGYADVIVALLELVVEPMDNGGGERGMKMELRNFGRCITQLTKANTNA